MLSANAAVDEDEEAEAEDETKLWYGLDRRHFRPPRAGNPTQYFRWYNVWWLSSMLSCCSQSEILSTINATKQNLQRSRKRKHVQTASEEEAKRCKLAIQTAIAGRKKKWGKMVIDVSTAFAKGQEII
jgi:hypothetical protein